MKLTLVAILLTCAMTNALTFDRAESESNLKSFASNFEEDRMYNNTDRREYRSFYNRDTQVRDFLKEQYGAAPDTKTRLAALFLCVKCWPHTNDEVVADAEHCSDYAAREFARRLRIYLGNIYEPPVGGSFTVEDVKSTSSTDRTRFVSALIRALETGKDDFISAALGRAELSKEIAFSEKAWPLAVAKAFKKATGATAKALNAHLQQNAALMSKDVQAEVTKLIEPATIDTLGGKVAAWSKAENGPVELADEVKKLNEAKNSKGLVALMNAIQTNGSARLLPTIAELLDGADETVAKAAWRAFEAHTKALKPDVRNPQEGYVWWMATGRHLIK